MPFSADEVPPPGARAGSSVRATHPASRRWNALQLFLSSILIGISPGLQGAEPASPPPGDSGASQFSDRRHDATDAQIGASAKDPARAVRRKEERELLRAYLAAFADTSSRPELTALPRKDYIADPVRYTTRTGAEPIGELSAVVIDPASHPAPGPAARQIAAWARANPEIAEHIGVFADAASGRITAALPGTMEAIADYRIETRDRLAPALRLAISPSDSPDSWREQIAALARGTVLLPDPASSLEKTLSAQLRAAGAALVPERLAGLLRAKAREIEGRLRSPSAGGKPGSEREAMEFARSVDSLLADLVDASSVSPEIPKTEEDFRATRDKIALALSKSQTGRPSFAQDPIELATDLARRRMEAANLVARRKDWKKLRGWEFPQEIGLREFFRLHGKEIDETLSTRDAWLSPRRRRIIKLLGFEYGKGGYKIPGYRELTENYERVADILKVPPANRIRFVRNFERPDGTILAIPEGKPIPAGFRPVTRPLTTREILEQIARREFPLAENEFLEQTGDIFYIHDAVSHAAAFLDDPSYALAMVNAAEALARREGNLDGLGKSVNRNGTLSNRIFYVLEELVSLRRAVSGPRLDQTLALPKGVLEKAGGYDKIQLKEVVAGLEKLTDAELGSRMKAVLGGLEKKVQSLGGNASDDFFLRRDKFHDLDKAIVNKMYFSKAWRLLIRASIAGSGLPRAERIEALARIQTYLARLSQVDPAALVADAMRPRQDETSGLWRLMRGSGILDPGKPDELKLLESMGLVDDLSRDAVRMKTELKYAIDDLSSLPKEVLAALKTGANHPLIKRRGLVAMDYLPVTSENMDSVFALLNAAGIPFGSTADQQAIKAAGKVAEIRLMRKRIKIREPENSLDHEAFREVFQVTIANGEQGPSVSKLESPEELTLEQARKIRGIVAKLQEKGVHRVSKAFFEHVLTDKGGRPIARPDGTPLTAEVDLVYDQPAKGPAVLRFSKAEVKFLPSEGIDAPTQVERWQTRADARPDYFGADLTADPQAKSREIAKKGPPERHGGQNLPDAASQEIFRGILGEYSGWASPSEAPAVREVIEVGVATASEVKVGAVKGAFERAFPGREIRVHAYKAPSGVANQPVMEFWGVKGAENRLAHAQAMELAVAPSSRKKIDYWVSMENYIEPNPTDPRTWIDRAAVIVTNAATGEKTLELSDSVRLPETFAHEAASRSTHPLQESGYSVTSGQVIRERYLADGVDLPADDWHRHSDFGGVSRSSLLESAIRKGVAKATAIGGESQADCLRDTYKALSGIAPSPPAGSGAPQK